MRSVPEIGMESRGPTRGRARGQQNSNQRVVGGGRQGSDTGPDSDLLPDPTWVDIQQLPHYGRYTLYDFPGISRMKWHLMQVRGQQVEKEG